MRDSHLWIYGLLAYLVAGSLASCTHAEVMDGKECSCDVEGESAARMEDVERDFAISATALVVTADAEGSGSKDPMPVRRVFFEYSKETLGAYREGYVSYMTYEEGPSYFIEGINVAFGGRACSDYKLSNANMYTLVLRQAWTLLQAGNEADRASRRKFLDDVIFGLESEDMQCEKSALFARIKSKCTEKRPSHFFAKNGASKNPKAAGDLRPKDFLSEPLIREAFAAAADVLTPEEVCRVLASDVFVGLLAGNFRAVENFADWSCIKSEQVGRIFNARIPTRRDYYVSLKEAESGKRRFNYELNPFKLPHFLATASSEVVQSVLESAGYDISYCDLSCLLNVRCRADAVACDVALSADLAFQALFARFIAIKHYTSKDCVGGEWDVASASLPLAPCFEAIHTEYRSRVGRLLLLRTALQTLVASEVHFCILLENHAPINALLYALGMRLKHINAIANCSSDGKSLMENEALAYMAATPLSFSLRKAFKAIQKLESASDNFDEESFYILRGLVSILDADRALLAKNYPKMFSSDLDAFDGGFALYPIQELLREVSLSSSPTAVNILWLMSKGMPYHEALQKEQVAGKSAVILNIARNQWLKEVSKAATSQTAALFALRATLASEVARRMPELAGNKDALGRLELLLISDSDFGSVILGDAKWGCVPNFKKTMEIPYFMCANYYAFLEWQYISLRFDRNEAQKASQSAGEFSQEQHLELFWIGGYICQLGVGTHCHYFTEREAVEMVHRTVFITQLKNLTRIFVNWVNGPLLTKGQIGWLLKSSNPVRRAILSLPHIYRNLSTLAEFTIDDVAFLKIDLDACRFGLHTCSESVVLDYLRRKECFLLEPIGTIFHFNERLWQSQGFRSIVWELISLPVLVKCRGRVEELGVTDVVTDQILELMSIESSPETVRELIWMLARLAVLCSHNYRIANQAVEMKVEKERHALMLSLMTSFRAKVDEALRRVSAYILRSSGDDACNQRALEWLCDAENWMSSEMLISECKSFLEKSVDELELEAKVQADLDTTSRLKLLVLAVLKVPDEQREKEALALCRQLDLMGLENMEKLQSIVETYGPTDSTRYVWSFRVKCCMLTRFKHIFPEKEADRKRGWPLWVIDAYKNGLVPLMDLTIASQTCGLPTKDKPGTLMRKENRAETSGQK